MPAAALRNAWSAPTARTEEIDNGRGRNIDSAHNRLTHDLAVRRCAEPPLESQRSLLDQHR